MQRRIFCFWTGSNTMPDNRQRGLESLRANSGCEVELITAEAVADFIPASELHPAYPFLNLAHRADFLRCYAMLRHGGGYADIKPHHESWLPAFDLLEREEGLFAVGYGEPGRRRDLQHVQLEPDAR